MAKRTNKIIKNTKKRATKGQQRSNKPQKRRRSPSDNSIDRNADSPSKRPCLETIKNEIEEAERPDQAKIQFTAGPTQLIVVDHGSKECTALLVMETFITKLADLFEGNGELLEAEGPIYPLKADARLLELSLEKLQESLEAAESREAAEELEKSRAEKTFQLLKIRQQLQKLEELRSMAEWKVSCSRNYTLHTLEAAMKVANLLRAPKPPTAVSNVNDDIGITRRRSMSSSNDSNIGASPEEQLRRAAREKLQEQAYYYTDVQAQFDDQKRGYLNNLEQYKKRVKEGEDIFSRSEFDRRALTYGMELNGALIDAEAAFDEH
ncbi:hypothetical protein OEA41_002499 [Lepraria neglecta]|uniref:Uncharacterized protein n=1 Tax=Lepraria neglecta TaxID=209136 RepID=A0AAD9ZEE5_9LECA|nr:hypothetical protein OEA41_002499 [Lepraria neglecta]